MLFISFWCHAESVGQGEENVTTHVVGPIFRAALCIDVVLPLRHLTEQVIALQFGHPAALMPRLGECGVPIETIVVHVGISIAAMRVHLQIGVDIAMFTIIIGMVCAIAAILYYT